MRPAFAFLFSFSWLDAHGICQRSGGWAMQGRWRHGWRQVDPRHAWMRLSGEGLPWIRRSLLVVGDDRWSSPERSDPLLLFLLFRGWTHTQTVRGRAGGPCRGVGTMMATSRSTPCVDETFPGRTALDPMCTALVGNYFWRVTTVGRHQSEATRFCFSFFSVAGRTRRLSEVGRVGHAGALAPWMAPSSLQGRTCSVPCMAHPSGQARDPLCATKHEGLSRSRPTPHPAHAGDQRSRHRSSARDGAAPSSTAVP